MICPLMTKAPDEAVECSEQCAWSVSNETWQYPDCALRLLAVSVYRQQACHQTANQDQPC